MKGSEWKAERRGFDSGFWQWENHETTATDSCLACEARPSEPLVRLRREDKVDKEGELKKASTWRSKPLLNVELNKGVELQDVYIT